METEIGTRGRALAVVLSLAVMALSGGPPRAAVARADSGDAARLLLDELPKLRDADRLRFSVPFSLLERQAAEELKGALPAESDAPVKAVLERWEGTLEPGDEEARLALVLRGKAFRAVPSDPVRLFLFPPDTVFKDLTVNGKPVTPLQTPDGFFAEMRQPGAFEVGAILTVRSRREGGERSWRLIKDAYAAAAIEVKAAAALDVRIPGAPGRVIGKDGRTAGTIAVGPAREFSVLWREAYPEVERDGTPVLTVSSAWQVGEKTLSVNASIEVAMIGGVLGQFSLALPPGADNVRLKGPDVRECRVEGSRADVFLKGKIGGRTLMDLSFDVPRQAKDTVSIPSLSVLNGRIGDGGWLLVGTETGTELAENSLSGLTPVSALEAPRSCLGLAVSPPSFLYRQTARETHAAFDVLATSPFPMAETIIDRAEIVSAISSGGEELTKIAYTVRNNRGQFLRLRMPREARLLHVAVENTRARLSSDGDWLLVPMPRSVQTLDRLVSFPVEVVYCAQRSPFARRGSLALDLPEVDGVSIALLNATLYLPEQCQLLKTAGGLEWVGRPPAAAGGGFSYGHGYSGARPGPVAMKPPPAPPDQAIRAELAQAYYHLGYQAYKDNRLEEAEPNLKKARELAHEEEDEVIKNAESLLANIRIARGEVTTGKPTSDEKRAVQAKAAQIRRNVARGNVELEVRQQDLIEEGLKQAAHGGEEQAAELLEEAHRVGAQLGQRGASQRDQSRITADFSAALKESKEILDRNRELQARLGALKAEAQKIVLAPKDAAAPQPQAEDLGLALIAQTGEPNQMADELQDVVTGPQDDFEANRRAGGRVESRVYAARHKAAATQPAAPQGQGQPSLREANTRLERQVAALQKALTVVKGAPNAPAPETPALQTENAAPNIVRQIERVSRKAKALNDELAVNRDTASLTDVQGREKLKEVEQAFAGVSNMYWSTTNVMSVAVAFKGLQESLDQSRSAVEAAEQRAAHAPVFTVRIGNDVPGVQTAVDQSALAQFIAKNNDGQFGTGQFGVIAWDSSGQLAVTNRGDNALVFGEALSNFRMNAGNVVTTAGRNVTVPLLGDLPMIGSLFQAQTEGGKRYAVLDEAQYRALMRSAAGGPPEAEAGRPTTPAEDTRALIVGASNWVAGVDVRVATAGADYNGYVVNGTEIRVPHTGYLALDNGSHVTILKGGAVRDWREPDAAPVVLRMEERFDVEVPAVGAAIRFTKTLLAGGESPDMVITYAYDR